MPPWLTCTKRHTDRQTLTSYNITLSQLRIKRIYEDMCMLVSLETCLFISLFLYVCVCLPIGVCVCVFMGLVACNKLVDWLINWLNKTTQIKRRTDYRRLYFRLSKQSAIAYYRQRDWLIIETLIRQVISKEWCFNVIQRDFTLINNPVYGNCYVFNSGWNNSKALKHASHTGRNHGLLSHHI